MLDEMNILMLIQNISTIYKLWIGGNKKLTDIYKRGIMCTHFTDYPSNSKCEKNEFCAYNYLLPSDKEMIEGTFNLFITLLELKTLIPSHPKLINFWTDVIKMISLHKKYGKIYGKIVERESRE